jgi:hypothetical protein
MIGGIHTYRHTHSGQEFMKYAVEMGLASMMYIPRFIKVGSATQKLIGVIHRHTDRMEIA